MFQRIAHGRTDLVHDWLEAGRLPEATEEGVSLLQWCAYYGDVTAVKLLVQRGASLATLGVNFDLNGAAFHGHWRLCQYLLEMGADVNHALADSGETALHGSLCKPNSVAHDRVVEVLLANGADPNWKTNPGVETGCFMRDCRTKGEAALHRAAAFGSEFVIQKLIDAGAQLDARDAHGDTPLSWASWYGRSDAILRKLCYGDFRVREGRSTMAENLQGKPSFE
jgi:ankyrin repeat protein